MVVQETQPDCGDSDLRSGNANIVLLVDAGRQELSDYLRFCYILREGSYRPCPIDVTRIKR